jgi:hypothetical protein
LIAFTGEAEPKQHGGQMGRGGQFQNRGGKKKEAAPIKFKRVQPAAQKGGKQQAKGGKQAKQAARK